MRNDLFKRKGGILLDLACGSKKNAGFIGLDKRKLPGVDIVHDLEKFPYPFPDNICLSIIGSHIVEHIKPWMMLQFMDELWRITKPEGKLAFVHPYGVNQYYIQDPTHCNPCNEKTWQYFDPRYVLYQIYNPKPWLIEKGFPVWQDTGVMEVVFRKLMEGQVYDQRI
jgi:SAM-dependent methyltransferase